MLEQKFKAALQKSEELKELATEKELLSLRGFYKQAVYGDNELGRPPMADVGGLAKWQVWRDLLGMPRDEAKQHYIDQLQKFCKLYNIK